MEQINVKIKNILLQLAGSLKKNNRFFVIGW